MSPTDDPRDLVAGARRMAVWVQVFAAVSFAGGWAIIVVGAVRWIAGWSDTDEALNLTLILGFGGVVSGIAMYATSWNLRLGAARLEASLKS